MSSQRLKASLRFSFVLCLSLSHCFFSSSKLPPSTSTWPLTCHDVCRGFKATVGGSYAMILFHQKSLIFGAVCDALLLNLQTAILPTR